MDLSLISFTKMFCKLQCQRAEGIIKGTNGAVFGTLWEQQKQRVNRVTQRWIDKTAQTGKRLNTSQIIYLFSERFPPVLFPVSSRKRALRLNIPIQLSSIWPREQAPPSSQHSLNHWLRQKWGFPITAEVHCSSPLLSILCPVKSKLQTCFLTKEIWENLCMRRRH